MFVELTRWVLHRRWSVRLLTAVHRLLYRLSGGAVGGLISGMPNLLLTTRGRRSGRLFTTPLFYLPDGDDLIVVASYGGHPRHPQWWQNLQSEPRGTVQVGPHHWPVQAFEADEALKARLWPVFCRYYPAYQEYQFRTNRLIPLVVLRPVGVAPLAAGTHQIPSTEDSTQR